MKYFSDPSVIADQICEIRTFAGEDDLGISLLIETRRGAVEIVLDYLELKAVVVKMEEMKEEI